MLQWINPNKSFRPYYIHYEDDVKWFEKKKSFIWYSLWKTVSNHLTKKKKGKKIWQNVFSGFVCVSKILPTFFFSEVDECQISTHNCSDNATCINTEGSFNCSCKPGYRGNGYNCSGRCLQVSSLSKKEKTNLAKRVFRVVCVLKTLPTFSFRGRRMPDQHSQL